MLTSEAAIKAIIESVIKNSQSNHELEQIGPSENLSQPLKSDHNLISDSINTGSAEADLEESPTDCYNSSLLRGNGIEASGKTTSQTGEENTKAGNLGEGGKNLEEGGKEQIANDEEKKKTRIQESKWRSF